jgi:hypothetical protein
MASRGGGGQHWTARAVLAALVASASPLRAQDGAASSGRRIQVVRASDGTSIGGAEVFDTDGGADGRGLPMRIRIEDADQEMPKVAPRLVADGDGYVTVGPGRWHRMLARAPGLHHWIGLIDLDRKGSERIELFRDLPLVIELVDERGDPVEGAIVEMGTMWMCDATPHSNDDWRAASDRDGRVFYPHYVSRISDPDLVTGDWLELQNPVAEPNRLDLRQHVVPPSAEFPEEGPRVLRWQLPPLAKIHVEFTGVETLPVDRAITFELVGPRQVFGEPYRYASDHGKPVELLTETGVLLRACFHWSVPDPNRWLGADLFAYGNGHPIVGGCALLRVPVASDPVALRVRPVRADGATLPPEHRFDLSLQWIDRQGFRFCSRIEAVAPDATGSLRFDWSRPRLDAGERPAKLRVALRRACRLRGWEPLEMPDLVVREVDWPEGGSLDVGTLVVPGS